MSAVTIALLVILLTGIAIGAYALLAPRPAKTAAAPTSAEMRNTVASTDWTKQAGQEFAGLSESARCDLIFAVTDLRDEHSEDLLEHALDDPSDAVALAAAHALAGRGLHANVDAYAAQHPGERAQLILSTLALLR